MIHFILLQNRNGKTRLAKFYVPADEATRERIKSDVHTIVNARDTRMTNFAAYEQTTLVYRRYAGLFFICAIDPDDNELAYLEFIHLLVEVLDMFFKDVCELDLVFNFHKVYMIIDEMVMGGEIEEVSRPVILSRLQALDITSKYTMASGVMLQRGLFYLGLALLLHGLYMAYSMREQLQAVHHSSSRGSGADYSNSRGGGGVGADGSGSDAAMAQTMLVSFAGTLWSVQALRLPLALEMLAGLAAAIVGFVRCKALKPARLSDQAQYMRYDQQMHTGSGFIHFNHRGMLAGRSAVAEAAGDAKDDVTTKKLN